MPSGLQVMNEFTSESLKTAWSHEYQRKGIPSSFRKDPTKPLVEFMAWCRDKGLSGSAADIGCGQGRNSFFLAQEGFKVIAVDIFCYKHIVEKEKQKHYRSELWRSLKPGGYYFISLASKNDGFYGPLLAQSPDNSRNLIVDPHAKIPSLLYSQDELCREFSDLFRVVEARENFSISPMYGKEYPRAVLNCIFQKN
ncbi:MAG: hypothetical protein JSS10_08520 [Verrucomicrobia bacterium]|nr:hypothetical protein [Verrucomicrobiota bacterium]